MANKRRKPLLSERTASWEPTDWQSFGILTLLTGLFFYRILSGTAFLWEDFIYQWYPFRQFAAASLASGELPLWNPYTVNGMPFLAEIQTEVFYLPMLALTLLVRDGRLDVYWLQLVNILHYLLAAGGMFLLARSYGLRRIPSLLAALTFAFSGFLVTHAIHQVITGVAAWFPLVLFLFRKALADTRWTSVFVAALALGHTFFAGSPQMSVYLYLLLFVYLVFELLTTAGWKRIFAHEGRAIIARAAAIVILSLGVTMIQLLPTQELSELSARAQITFARASEGSFAWSQVVTFLIPKFFGAADAHAYTYWGPGPYWHYWETCLYIGILPFLLVLLSSRLVRQDRHVAMYALLAVFAFLFVLGDNFPLYSFFFHSVPGFASFRNPARMGVLLTFAGSLLAGFTAHAMLYGSEGTRREHTWTKALLVAGGGSAAVVMLALLGLADSLLPATLEPQARNVVRNEMMVSLLFIIASTALLYAILRRTKPSALSGLTLCILVFADLYRFGAGQNTGELDPTDHFRRSEPLVRFLKSQDGIFRVNTRNAQGMIMDRNQGMVDRLYTMEGYTPLVLQRIFPPAPGAEPYFDLLNVRFYTETDTVRRTLSLRERERVLDRAHVVFSITTAGSEEEVRTLMSDPGFDPWTMAVVEDTTYRPPAPPAQLPSGNARIREHTNNRIVVDAELDQEGLLVLSEAFYPGWRAIARDRQFPVLRTNYCQRGIPLPPGNHRIELRYEPATFARGSIVTLATLAVCGIGIAAGVYRSRRKGASTLSETGTS